MSLFIVIDDTGLRSARLLRWPINTPNLNRLRDGGLRSAVVWSIHS